MVRSFTRITCSRFLFKWNTLNKHILVYIACVTSVTHTQLCNNIRHYPLWMPPICTYLWVCVSVCVNRLSDWAKITIRVQMCMHLYRFQIPITSPPPPPSNVYKNSFNVDENEHWTWAHMIIIWLYRDETDIILFK